MKNLRIPLSVWTAGLAILTTTGCKTVVRENIISHINTGIGISLTENPKTELYEVKAGFIRTQFYSVPTGKTVESEKEDGTGASNAANLTPEVVSGIRAHSGVQHLFLGMDVMENFAVGKAAVNSPAAVAMYISTARSDARAQEATEGVRASAQSIPEAPPAELAPLARAYAAFAAKPEKKKVFDDAAKSVGYASFRNFLLGRPSAPKPADITTVTAKLNGDAQIQPFIK